MLDHDQIRRLILMIHIGLTGQYRNLAFIQCQPILMMLRLLEKILKTSLVVSELLRADVQLVAYLLAEVAFDSVQLGWRYTANRCNITVTVVYIIVELSGHEHGTEHNSVGGERIEHDRALLQECHIA